ncbi:MAG: hypothetical protein OXI05_12370 [Bacteroidota bacterium]|nr:hypothetical protein [Bacteroidota bacterium]MXW14926.1 hypothetical protein [Rhodothermaceae bacterium]MXW33088.1 hypothetical protein [Rhodothermaceae bacterium]MXZ17619.1 hypothetical protein [Rhodothermaceae bacterium]MYC05167.1 hypothetical protein [Rhodothermaceae bacterium]
MAFDEPKFHAARKVSVGNQIRALLGEDLNRSPLMSSPSTSWDTLVWLGRQVDWNSEGSKLVQGQLGGIPQEIAVEIMDFAQKVEDFVDQLGMSSHILVIALAAYAVQGSSKWAARVYRGIVREYDQEEFERIALDLRYTR